MYKHIIYSTCLVLLIFMFLLLIQSLRKKKQSTTRSFAATTGATAVWISLLWVADTTSSSILAKMCVNLAIPCVSILTSLFLLFALDYPNQHIKKRKVLIGLLTLLNIIILIFAVLGKIILSVSLSRYGASIEKSSNLYIVHQVQADLSIILGLVVLNLKKRNLDVIEKTRISIMTLGVFVALGANIISGTVVTYIDGFQWFNIVATASVVFFVASIGYTILRYKLFDVKLIIARAVAYLLTLATVASFYSLFIFIFLANILGADKVSVAQRSTYSILAVLFGFSLPPLKKFFDKLTNALFYKDAYDAQAFLDQLNKILVGNIDLQPLLRQCAEHIEATLKAEYCLFAIRETESTPRRIIGTRSRSFTEADITQTIHETPHIHQKVIVVDELEEGHVQLKKTLAKNDIVILARLISNTNQKQGQGYILLGAKKSGNPYNKQDLQVLEIVVNELVIAIQNAMRFEEIQAFNVTLQEKVNEATRQLRRTNEKLKALDETKDEFISMASHQLRTPLTSVKGYVSMVIEGDAGKISKQQHELLGQAFASSQRMVYLIADLLNVSRLRTGKFVIEDKPTRLADVIETELSQLEEAAKSKQQTLTYKKPKDFPTLMLDETKIRQVIMNFTDNALYYTPAGGNITVSLEDKGSTIEFKVVDDGIGVPKAEQHHMFTKFYRAGNARKARPDGTGLGLFMAKKVIVAEGGAVIFESQEGKGSTFGFSFPKNKLKVPAKLEKTATSPDDLTL